MSRPDPRSTYYRALMVAENADAEIVGTVLGRG
jgi:hypothetical protein